MSVDLVSLLQFVAAFAFVSDVDTEFVIVDEGFGGLLNADDLNREVDGRIGGDWPILYTTVRFFRWTN